MADFCQDAIFTEVMKGSTLYQSVDVVKNTKGYNWSAKVAGCNTRAVMSKLFEIEEKLANKFGESK